MDDLSPQIAPRRIALRQSREGFPRGKEPVKFRLKISLQSLGKQIELAQTLKSLVYVLNLSRRNIELVSTGAQVFTVRKDHRDAVSQAGFQQNTHVPQPLIRPKITIHVVSLSDIQ